MLKIATAASLLIALLCVPTAWADQSIGDSSGFGTASMPSEPTNTQLPETGMQGDEALAPPGASAQTGTQGNHSRNLPNLPPVSTGMPFKHSFSAPGSLALQSQGLTELPDARFAILSNKEAANGVLPDARYAVISDTPAPKFVAPPISKVAGAASSVLNIMRITEGY